MTTKRAKNKVDENYENQICSLEPLCVLYLTLNQEVNIIWRRRMLFTT